MSDVKNIKDMKKEIHKELALCYEHWSSDSHYVEDVYEMLGDMTDGVIDVLQQSKRKGGRGQDGAERTRDSDSETDSG